MKRAALKKKLATRKQAQGQYFSDARPTEFFSTGCMLLDCALGFGWPVGKVANIVGDKSTGKTLLAIEAFANFSISFPDGECHYMEAEAAFDVEYAERVGMPVQNLMIHDDIDTVEQFFIALEKVCNRPDNGEPALVILDSLDSLSDAEEMDKAIGESPSLAKKARKMSELFRRLVRKCKHSRTSLIVVSQTRDKIGVMFGRRYSRSGGKALDFYAALVLYLAEIGKVYKTKTGIKRPIGVKIKARVDKNKVSAPFRECVFPIMFDYGMDDMQAALDWFIEIKRTDVIVDLGFGSKPSTAKIEKLIKEVGFDELRKELSDAVRAEWKSIEADFRPQRSKYL